MRGVFSGSFFFAFSALTHSHTPTRIFFFTELCEEEFVILQFKNMSNNIAQPVVIRSNRRLNRGPTVREILKDDLLLPVFRDFLEATLCVENLLFFQEVERFNQLLTDQERLAKFTEICARYLSHDSELELDFPDELRVMVVGASVVEEDVFLMLQAEAYGTLTRDSLPRFLVSPEYEDFLANPPDSPRVARQRHKLEGFFGEQLVGPLQRIEVLDKVLKRQRRAVSRLHSRPSLGRFGWAKSHASLVTRPPASLTPQSLGGGGGSAGHKKKSRRSLLLSKSKSSSDSSSSVDGATATKLCPHSFTQKPLGEYAGARRTDEAHHEH
jgi:Regulator of G protein signaling domain